MPTIASLIVRIGANDQQIQSALASVGQKAKSVDADLKKLGGTALGAKAEASLKDLKSTMDGITKAQERVAEKARLAAAGLEAMGGVARLTEKELKQVQRTLNEGVSAYEALGKKAPAELQKVADAVKGKLDAPMGTLNTKMIALGTALGTSLAGAAQQIGRQLLTSAKATLDFADALSNMSAKTGVSVEGLQRLEALGVTSGVSMETLAGAVGQLQKHLDDPAAQKSLAEMGLNYQRIRNLEPEDQFLEIAKSVAAIKDPVERANAGAALFGKQWETIAPAITGDIDAIISSMHGLSKEQVEALDAAGDAWDKWQKQASNAFDRFLGNIVIGAQKAELTIGKSLLDPVGSLSRLLQQMDKEARNFEGNMPKVRDPGFTFKPYDPAQATQGANLNRILAESDEKLGGLIKKADELAKSRAAAFTEQLFNRDAIANAEGLMSALGGVENLTKLTATATATLHAKLGEAIDVYRVMGREVPAALQEIYNKTLPLRTFEVKAVVGPSLRGMQQTFVNLGEVLQNGTVYARDLTYELTAGTIQLDKYGNVIKTEVIPPLGTFGVTIAKTITLTQQLGDGVKKAFGSLPDLLKQAFTGGGGLLGAAKAFGVQLAEALTAPLMARLSATLAKFGGAISGAIGIGGTAATAVAGTAAAAGGAAAAGAGGAAAGGAAAGGGILGGITAAQAIPIAGAVAAGVYGIVKGVQALKAQAAHKEVNRLREAFFNLQGGLESINPRVQEMTGNVDAVQAVFDAKNPEQYEAAIANLTGVLDAYNAKWAEQQRLFEDLSVDVGTVTEKLAGITTITPDVQKALEAVFDETTTEGYLGAIRNLNTELDKQKKKYDEIEGTLSKYGISFQSAGNEFKQAKLNERAQTLTKDFLTLKGAGVEINTQMRGMGKEIRDFIKDAQVAGIEVPESMRSIIQHAIDAGEVFDKDGKKITDMKDLGLTFGTTMETTMAKVGLATDRLTLVLEDLAKFLKEKLPNAAKEGAEKTNDELGKIEDPVVTVKYRDEGPGSPGFVPPPESPGAASGARVRPWGLQHLASGGLARGTDTVPAMLTPGELVLNKDQQRALFGGGAPVVVNLSIAIDGVFSEGDLVQTVQRRVAPILAQTIEDNVAGSRTRFQDVLGVT